VFFFWLLAAQVVISSQGWAFQGTASRMEVMMTKHLIAQRPVFSTHATLHTERSKRSIQPIHVSGGFS
jgi:hypothetical protein